MVKHCKRCDTTKPTSEFHKCRGRSDGLAWWCKDCANKHRQAAYCPNKNREYQLKCLYNLSTAEYDDMYKLQEGACKICRKNFDQLVVDHCHNSGKVRGLLCQKCNRGLGSLGDNISTLKNAIAYLTEHSEAPQRSAQ